MCTGVARVELKWERVSAPAADAANAHADAAGRNAAGPAAQRRALAAELLDAKRAVVDGLVLGPAGHCSPLHMMQVNWTNAQSAS
jgi:hypothetical protein